MSESFDVDVWERKHSRYFLQIGRGPEREVSELEFIAAEREAGFFPKSGCGPIATAGFGTENISGRIEFVSNFKDLNGS